MHPAQGYALIYLLAVVWVINLWYAFPECKPTSMVRYEGVESTVSTWYQVNYVNGRMQGFDGNCLNQIWDSEAWPRLHGSSRIIPSNKSL